MTRDLDKYRNRLREPYWLNNVEAVRAVLAADPLEKPEYRSLAQRSCEAIGRGRLGLATNWVVLGLVANAHRMLANIRRVGALRCSRYFLNSGQVVRLSRELLAKAAELDLNPEHVEYLRSVEALSLLAGHVAPIQKGLIRTIRSERGFVLKGLLAQVELLFAYPREPDRSLATDDPNYYSMEELAEAFSYIYYLHNSQVGRSASDLVLMDAHRVASGAYLPLLVDACVIRRFLEWEIQVDSLGYRCRCESANTFVVEHPDEQLEKAIRFGFVQSEARGDLLRRQVHAQDVFGVERAARSLSKAIGSRGFQIVDKPIRRIRCHFPVFNELKEAISAASVFTDEALFVKEKAETYLTPVNNLLEFEIADGVKTIDLVRVQRLVNLLRFYSLDKFDPYRSSDPALVAQSILPSWNPPDLLELLKAAIPEYTAEKVIRLLCWSGTTDSVFDLQYQPFVGGEPGTYLIPLSVFGSSDVVRNALQLSRRRIQSPEDATEPMCSLLAEVLRPHSNAVVTNLQFGRAKTQGEIDVLAVVGRIAFGFECKSSLLPASPHELRTTFDHLWKAADQLGSLSSLWGGERFRSDILGRVGVNSQDVDELVTCVVTSNRMFAGARVNRYPVRSLFELVNFINDGEVRIAEFPVRLRRKGSMSSGALKAYVVGDSVHRPTFAAMIRRTSRHRIRSAVVREETFALDGMLLAENFGFRPTEEQWMQMLNGRNPFLPTADRN